MAMSNWDTLAVDEKGTCNGEFVSKAGVRVDIYKNWVYIRDENAWHKCDNGFCSPTIMQINEGNVQYQDVHIVAVQGPQNGIFCAVYQNEYPVTKMMVGCGVYGFLDDDKLSIEDAWVGVSEESKKFLKDFVKKQVEEGNLEENILELNIDGGKRFNQGDAFFERKCEIHTARTDVGKAKPPVIVDFIKKMNEDE